MKRDKEVWLRGEFVPDIIPLLQPVAHSLLQAEEEIKQTLENFQEDKLWERPAGCASSGFHLLHITGFLDRLLTYAEGKGLSPEQLKYLQEETTQQNIGLKELVFSCCQQIHITIDRLTHFSTEQLVEKRFVGRAGLPSTVIGLCTHAAEHTMRHVGQLLITVKISSQNEAG